MTKSMKKIQIFDTTLRDGEQTPGVNFNTREKVQIAKQLVHWGVDVIEAGFPITSQGDFEAVQTIAREVKGATICGLARCQETDIDRAYEALIDAEDKQVHVFLATSPIHREYKLKMTKEEIKAAVKKYVTYARSKFEKVQFSPEDATRTELDFLAEVVEIAIASGATVINIPDTVGYTTPSEFAQLFQYLKQHVSNFDEAIFSCHCHNDLGMAVANSLTAVENGALRIEGTVNGIGERAGNVALEECATAIYIRRDHFNAETNIKLNETKRMSDLVSRLSGLPIPRNKAVVGVNAYAHESGIHQDGVLKNPNTYEIITPQLVGVSQSSLPLGKLSGRHAFVEKVESMGIEFDNDKAIQEAFVKFKDLADKKKKVTEADLYAIVTGRTIENNGRYELVRLTVQSIDEAQQAATVAIRDHRNPEQARLLQDTGVGKGSVEAVYSTIDKMLNTSQQTLLEYNIDAVTEGIDAQAQVHVLVQSEDGSIHNGTGIDYDVLNASAKAYLRVIE